jgi:hypothetical protein
VSAPYSRAHGYRSNKSYMSYESYQTQATLPQFYLTLGGEIDKLYQWANEI